MATKKQKREAGIAKREAFEAEQRERGLHFLKLSQEETRAQREKADKARKDRAIAKSKQLGEAAQAGHQGAQAGPCLQAAACLDGSHVLRQRAVMGRYRKRPVEVEAVQFTGERLGQRCMPSRGIGTPRQRSTRSTWMSSTRSVHICCPSTGRKQESCGSKLNGAVLPIVKGEWVIKDTLGFYPCKDEVFVATYEEV